MVVKGSARGGAGELATHLLRADTNERVRIIEYHGVASSNLRNALIEMDAMGAGSRSKRTLYHASINTPPHEQLTPAQQDRARARLGSELGLSEQPYVVVEHVKHGRQHTHIVWSRINCETGRAIPDSHNYRKHEVVSRELEMEFGHNHVQGVHVRDKEAEPRPKRGPTWGEQRQAERSGLSPEEVKKIVTDCWQQTHTAHEFRKRVEAAGFVIARGDRRDFILVDWTGEVHGLSRRIEGVKAALVKARMEELNPVSISTVKEVRTALQLGDQQQERNLPGDGTVERLHKQDKEDAKRARESDVVEIREVPNERTEQVKPFRRKAEHMIAGSDEGLATPSSPYPNAQKGNSAEILIAKESKIDYLFVRVLGWLIEHYHKLLDQARTHLSLSDKEQRRPPAVEPKFSKEAIGRQVSKENEFNREIGEQIKPDKQIDAVSQRTKGQPKRGRGGGKELKGTKGNLHAEPRRRKRQTEIEHEM